MASLMLRSSKRLLTCPRVGSHCNWRIARRSIATAPTASGDTSNLPLAGIKVLDMTRVLAGVGDAFNGGMIVADFHNSHIVLKFWEILGMRWTTLYEPTCEVGHVQKLY
jgi:hypothetical protein